MAERKKGNSKLVWNTKKKMIEVVRNLTYSSDKNLWREIGNVLTQWELLPNDLRTDPSFEPLEKALANLYTVVETAERVLGPRESGI
jgi:hypothetical protein